LTFSDPDNSAKIAHGFSTSKAFSQAMQDGQRIYEITPSNKNIALSNIILDANSMSEINNALATGKHVMAHTSTLSYYGYRGAGYVIFDPVTGSGAYKISGGKNGGETCDGQATDLASLASMMSDLGYLFDAATSGMDIALFVKGLQATKLLGSMLFGIGTAIDIISAITTIADILDKCKNNISLAMQFIMPVIYLTLTAIIFSLAVFIAGAFLGPIDLLIWGIVSSVFSSAINAMTGEISKMAEEACDPIADCG
jgi:hypothetical protein